MYISLNAKNYANFHLLSHTNLLGTMLSPILNFKVKDFWLTIYFLSAFLLNLIS